MSFPRGVPIEYAVDFRSTDVYLTVATCIESAGRYTLPVCEPGHTGALKVLKLKPYTLGETLVVRSRYRLQLLDSLGLIEKSRVGSVGG